MTYEELEILLAPYLLADVSRGGADNSAQTVPLCAPLGNFFDDPMMLMIYHSTADTLPEEFADTRALLYTASDESQPRAERARAALGIGRWIIENRRAGVTAPKDRADRWLDVAMRWGSVVAHTVAADMMLAEAGLKLSYADEHLPLPSVVPLDKNNALTTLAPRTDVRYAWEGGAHLALTGSLCRFREWDEESLEAAFTCVSYHVAYLPPSYGASRLTQEHARPLLNWAVPLLWLIGKCLITVRPNDKKQARTLERRQQAIRLMLEYAAAEPLPDSQGSTNGACEPTVESVVVIKGQIPSTTDRSDNEMLAKYEVLRRPMPLAPMPSLTRIAEMRCALVGEFPWASDAIDIILDELLARKRHGSNVLGMQPVLLVGPPAAGKTRLAQRLSDLLSIPSTVISMSSMSDSKVIKGTSRGWASNRPSRILECIASTGPSHLFLLDEVDKAQPRGSNGGSAQEALLDLLEPGNAKRFADEFLLAEADISNCLYVLTSNSLRRIPDPLLSRVALAYVPSPGPEHSMIIAAHMLRDLERAWRIPEGTLELTYSERSALAGLSPREMRRAILNMMGSSNAGQRHTLH